MTVAVIVAVAVDADGRREIVGLHVGPSEAETFWSTFLKRLVKRGLTGVKLVVSDAHEGLKHAIGRVLGSTWQRCRVHWMRNALAHVPKGQHTVVAAALRQAFLQPDAEAAARPGARSPISCASAGRSSRARKIKFAPTRALTRKPLAVERARCVGHSHAAPEVQ